jgi:hypothetical protein
MGIGFSANRSALGRGHSGHRHGERTPVASARVEVRDTRAPPMAGTGTHAARGLHSHL